MAPNLGKVAPLATRARKEPRRFGARAGFSLRYTRQMHLLARSKYLHVLLKKRDARTNLFREAWSLLVDPHDMFVDDSRPPSAGPLIALQKKGEPAAKVDLLILGDGYTAHERGKFEKDARRLMEVLFT